MTQLRDVLCVLFCWLGDADEEVRFSNSFSIFSDCLFFISASYYNSVRNFYSRVNAKVLGEKFNSKDNFQQTASAEQIMCNWSQSGWSAVASLKLLDVGQEFLRSFVHHLTAAQTFIKNFYRKTFRNDSKISNFNILNPHFHFLSALSHS